MNYFDYLDFYVKKDLEFNSYIKKPPKYLIPENGRIRYILNNPKLDTKDNRDFIKEASMFFYHKIVEDDFTEESFVKEEYLQEAENLSEEQKTFIGKKKPIFDPLINENVPGATPLIQACYLLESLIENGADPQNATSEDIKEAVEQLKAVDDRLADEELKEIMAAPAKINYLPRKMRFKLLNTMSLLESLGNEFKVEKKIEENEMLGGTIPNTIPMKRFEQLFQIPAIQFLYPNFKVKLATKDLLVDIYTEKTEHLQKIIILIDSSGK